MKIKVQAQHLKVGDIVGSGETVTAVHVNSIHIPTTKVQVSLEKGDKKRSTFWSKYTEITVEREE